MTSRFRLFAGPNGSGKSSLFQHLKLKGVIKTEIYVSADRIEADLQKTQQFHFNAYRVKVSQKEFIDHIQKSGLWERTSDKTLLNDLQINAGILTIARKHINSYTASLIASFLVEKLMPTKQSFCFETVMSHSSKLKLLDLAVANGYKTYLYFVFTEDPQLNKFRVKQRVLEGGHSVDEQKITNRFFKSFQILPEALKKVARGFLINNSVSFDVVAEKRDEQLFWFSHPPHVLKAVANS
ncbi:MAG: zeta toxin family protein [Chitinophagales bacterium]